MTREQAKELLPIIQAFCEGETIQAFNGYKWIDSKEENINISVSSAYRIKPSSTYRPFASAEECWNEIQKHLPIGWVKNIEYGSIESICYISNMGATICQFTGFMKMFEEYIFIDGTPFGVKIDEK